MSNERFSSKTSKKYLTLDLNNRTITLSDSRSDGCYGEYTIAYFGDMIRIVGKEINQIVVWGTLPEDNKLFQEILSIIGDRYETKKRYLWFGNLVKYFDPGWYYPQDSYISTLKPKVIEIHNSTMQIVVIDE